MKKINSILLLSFLALFSGCSVIGGIFKTGVGVGIFVVLAVALLLFLAFGRKSKS